MSYIGHFPFFNFKFYFDSETYLGNTISEYLSLIVSTYFVYTIKLQFFLKLFSSN